MDPFAVSGPNGFDVSLRNLVEATVGLPDKADSVASTVVPFRRRSRWRRVARVLRRR